MARFVFPSGFTWPVEPGDYVVKDPECPVAVCTLRSKIDLDAPYAIKGTCFTENIGIERIILNLISNPNIRFLVLCGAESAGHYTGESIRNLKVYGVEPQSKKIRNSRGPFSFLRNLPLEAIDRFRRQLQVIDLIDVLDPLVIAGEIRGLLRMETGAFEEEPMIISAKKAEEKETEVATEDVMIAPELNLILDPYTSLVHNPTES
jgi:tetrahydromethanopterin S-methyltransferase subunit A